jgi:hypothetical protein
MARLSMSAKKHLQDDEGITSPSPEPMLRDSRSIGGKEAVGSDEKVRATHNRKNNEQKIEEEEPECRRSGSR